MSIEFRRSRPALTESDLAAFEERLHIKLPQDYRNFLLVNNGGKPRLKTFPIQNNPSDTHAYIEYFLCICEDDIYDLSIWIRRYRHRVPMQMIPIAIDPGGNLICLTISGENPNKLYFWDHENEVEQGSQPWDKNLYFIANNFTELIYLLS